MRRAARPAVGKLGKRCGMNGIIESVTATPVRLPLERPVRWATGAMTCQAHVLVRVRTTEGAEGIAEAIPRENIYGETQVGMVHVINDLLAPLIVGLDVFDVEKIHEKMNFIKANLAAKGGIDVALWDLMGKLVGLPCYKLLGGYRESIAPSRILWLGETSARRKRCMTRCAASWITSKNPSPPRTRKIGCAWHTPSTFPSRATKATSRCMTLRTSWTWTHYR